MLQSYSTINSKPMRALETCTWVVSQIVSRCPGTRRTWSPRQPFAASPALQEAMAPFDETKQVLHLTNMDGHESHGLQAARTSAKARRGSVPCLTA